MQNTTACTIDGCPHPRVARGWCSAHWTRWKRHGDPERGGPLRIQHRTPEERFAANTERRGDCLIWTGHDNGAGYGLMRIPGGRVLTHRWAWEQTHGTIPDGVKVDHAEHCSTLCCEVAHLRLASTGNNAANRAGATVKSKTGVRNVRAVRGRFQVAVQHEGVEHYYGLHDTIEEAAVVAEGARRELFGTFAGRG